jgi:hypothetical protein
MTADGLRRLIVEEVPLAAAMGVEVVSIGGGKAALRVPRGGPITRPGATVGGPLISTTTVDIISSPEQEG